MIISHEDVPPPKAFHAPSTRSAGGHTGPEGLYGGCGIYLAGARPPPSRTFKTAPPYDLLITGIAALSLILLIAITKAWLRR